jgi:predicted DNA-binding transcriptional regulator AlpA
MAPGATVACGATVARGAIAPHAIATSYEFTFIIGENQTMEIGNQELRQADGRAKTMNKDKIILPDPASISAEKIAPIMAQVAAVQLALASRLIAENEENAQDESDTLLTVEEAAAKLKCSQDWLYRKSKHLPYAVRVGRSLRFSLKGIEADIRSRMGAA